MRSDRFRRLCRSLILATSLLLVLAAGCSGESGDPARGEWTAAHERLKTIGDHGMTASDDVPFALDRLKNGSTGERVLAAWALGEIGHAGAEPALREAFEDKDANVRSNALGALVSEDEPVRIGAADALGAARGDGVAEALARGATAAAKDVRVHVAFALGKIEDAAAIPVLASLLEDESWEVRANAVQALGKYGEPAAVEAVRGMLDDPNASVRAVAQSIVDGV